MVPAGDATEAMIDELLTLLEPGDTIVTRQLNFHDSVRTATPWWPCTAVNFVDAGVSGDLGSQIGYCLMAAGARAGAAPGAIFPLVAPTDGTSIRRTRRRALREDVHNGIE